MSRHPQYQDARNSMPIPPPLPPSPVTGPQLLGMSEDEMASLLHTTPLQFRKITTEIENLSLSSVVSSIVPLTTANIAAATATLPPPTTTATTEASLATTTMPVRHQSYAEEYPPPSTAPPPPLPGGYGDAQMIAATTPGSTATTAYFATMNTLKHQSPPAPLNYIAATTAQQQQQQLPPVIKTPHQQYADHRPLCRQYFILWCIFLTLLLGLASADLGLSIYLNGQLQDVFSGYAYYRNVYRVHWLNGEAFWCILFFIAQGYAIVATIVLLLLHVVVGYHRLSTVRNLTFGSTITAFVGLALYALPISKWTYVVAVEYGWGNAFGSAPSVIPAVVFGLEWAAVGVWLVLLIVGIVQLIKLASSKYE